MASGYKPLPTLFWNRLVMLIIFISGAYLGTKLLPKYFYFLYFIDPSLVFSILLIAVIIGWFIFFRVAESPFFTALLPLMFLFWLIMDKFMAKVAVSVKPQYLALGFIVFGGIIIIYKNFSYLWKFQMARFLMAFAVVNIIFYFFNSSDFNVSAEGAVYGWTEGSKGQDAKLVVFLGSIFSLFAFCVPAALFSKISSIEQLKLYLNKTGNVFFVGFLIYFALIPITISCMPAGDHVIIPLNLFFMLTLKIFIDNYSDKGKWYSFFYALVLFGVFTIFLYGSNKSSLLALIASFGLYAAIHFFITKYDFKIIKIQRQKYLTPILVFIGIILTFIISEAFGIIDIMTDTISRAIRSLSGESGISSWYIRQNNWYYFILHWLHNIDLSNFLFGFGLGASRETMFYISATQYSKQYFVQTTHNQFSEMFYDYGLTSMLFYLPIAIVFFKDIVYVLSKNTDRLVKLFCASNISMIFFVFIYHIADGLRVPTTIIFFSLIAFNEMVKHTLITKRTA